MENIFAFTETNYQPSFYPGFISINKQNDGTLSVSVRERGNDTGKAALIDVSPETLEHLAAAIMAFFGAQEADRTPAADAAGRTNEADETGGAVRRFGFDCTKTPPEIIPAANGAYVWFSDYAKLFAAARPGNDAAQTLVRFILENADKFEWSLQGLGMLRLYLTKDIRLHVWDLRFAFPGASPIHDHLQWGLTSFVIAGRITNYRFIEAADGDEYLYSTLKPGYGCYFKHDPLPIKLHKCAAETYTAGMTYSQRPEEIHWSVPENGTVTLMRKEPTADADSARVFWPAGEAWGSAEPRRATAEEVRAITAHALGVLASHARSPAVGAAGQEGGAA